MKEYDDPMTVTPIEGLRHISEPTVTKSSSKGTVLPRSGVFWGVHVPQSHRAVVVGELASSSADETPIRVWLEPHRHLTKQTSLVLIGTGRMRLADFEIDLDAISTGAYMDQTLSRFATGPYSSTMAPNVIRDVDVACAFFPRWGDLTESPWRRLRHALAPLRTEAILEAIRTELEQDTANPHQSRHAGLAAVAWLTRMLELSRPTILRMGGVPESTFYAWQKNPQSVVRTPSVSRLLRLQAQVG